MSARPCWTALLALATGAVTACHESPAAPAISYSTVTLALDTIDYGAGAFYTTAWQGTSALISPDGYVTLLAWDSFNGVLRFHGCASACDDPASWRAGSVEVGSQPLWRDGIGNGAVSAAGIRFVYSDAQGVRFLSCAGACDVAGNWTGTDLFADRGTLSRSAASRPLAVDGTGRLHLLFYDLTDSTFHYASCVGGCGASSSWPDVQVDTAKGVLWASLVAVAPNGTVHAFYQTAAGWTHATCSVSCTTAGSWRSELVVPLGCCYAVTTASGAFGPDGRLHMAWTLADRQVRYATCGSPCTPPARWSVTALPDSAGTLSLASDPQGRLVLATSWRSVALTTCAVDCLDPGGWHSSAVASALGNGEVSVALDAAGRPILASGYGGFPTILQYSQSR